MRPCSSATHSTVNASIRNFATTREMATANPCRSGGIRSARFLERFLSALAKIRRPARGLVALAIAAGFSLDCSTVQGEPLTSIAIDGLFDDWAGVPAHFDALGALATDFHTGTTSLTCTTLINPGRPPCRPL